MKYRASPTKRSLELLRKRGYTVDIVERWIPYVRVRKDVFGFGDLLCCMPEKLPFLVQCTSGDNHAKRRNKILSLDSALVWFQSGCGILLMSWAKRGERGKRKLWTCREEWIDFR